MNRSRLSFTLLVAFLSALPAVRSWADPIVTFSSANVTLVPPYPANTNYADIQRTVDVNTTSQQRWNFDTTAPLFSSATNPLQASEGAVFYGGINVVDSSTTLDPSFARLHTDNPTGWPSKPMVFWNGNDNSGGTNYFDMNALMVWKRADFLTGGSPVAFDVLSTLSVKIEDWTGNAGGTGLPIDIRFVARNGSQYYVSEASATSGSSVFSLDDFNDNGNVGKRWAAFNPTATDFGLPGSLIYNAVDFTDLTEVGVLGQGSGAYFRLFGFDQFSATATIVPEPGTLALLAFGSLAVLHRRRKKA